MVEWPFVVFLGVRVASVPLTQTWFVPDEYWQATEVAHSMAFRYGYRTWEWREGIRGVLYPASLALLFKVMFVLGVDTPTLLVHIPRLLHAVAFAIGDYHIWKLCRVLYGSASARWTVVCLTTAWFLNYCAPRTLTSCVETVLLAVAFFHYPWRRERDNHSAKYLWPVGLACSIRPTAAVPFLPLAARHLWFSSCRARLMMYYILIITVIFAGTVFVDSWYYGELVVVPWRFVHFNVVTGLSSHYGTLPWHWYLSQGFPATLTTHLLPLGSALVLRPSRYKDFMPVILWSLLVYSGLGHKELRFLLPVLPLCLCVAGDHIAFHLAAHAKRTGSSASIRKVVIFLVFLIPNLAASVYLGLIHQRGPLDTMHILQKEIDINPQANILFLMPCHSTPYYSHLHRNVTMRFLTCEPNLRLEDHYLDEADRFDKDPNTWLLRELDGQYPVLPSFFSNNKDNMRNLNEENLESEDLNKGMKGVKESEKNGMENLSRELMGDAKKRIIAEVEEVDKMLKKEPEKQSENRVLWRKSKLQVESKNYYMNNEESHTTERVAENKVMGKKDGSKHKMKYAVAKTSSINLPSHIVMFSVLKNEVADFLSAHHYHLCHQVFHSHVNDGRRSQYIHIYCR